MSEIVSALGSGGGGGGGGGGGSTGAGIFGSGGSNSYGIAGLQGLSTGAGLLAQLAASNKQADGYEAQAADARISSGQSIVAGENQQSNLKGQLLSTLGQSAAGYAASGVDTGQGIARDSATQTSILAGRAMTLDRLNADVTSRRFLARADEDDQAAADARRAGTLGMLGQGLSFATKLFTMGV